MNSGRGTRVPGLYTLGMTLGSIIVNHEGHVPNNGDEDELVWAALWLHRATGERAYLNEAKDFYFYQKFRLRHRETPRYFSNRRSPGIDVPNDVRSTIYADDARKFCDEVAFNKAYYTPRGLLISVRKLSRYLKLTFYSSCPSSPARCGFEQLNSSSANPHLLLGALVEGPDAEDRYVDARDKDNAVGIVVLDPKFQSYTPQVPMCMELVDRLSTPEIPGFWTGKLTLTLPMNLTHRVRPVNRLVITFDRPVTSFKHTMKNVFTHSVDNQTFFIRGQRFSSKRAINLSFHFNVTYKGHAIDLARVRYNLAIICSGTKEPQYDYKEALKLTLLFLEAQRSGLLPLDNRVPWRGDSCLNDIGKNGEDLTGGYFTDGRTVKFTFPNAAANTLLAWSVIAHKTAYVYSGQLVHGLDAVEWGANHLAKCHTYENDLYAILGDLVKEQHEWWGRADFYAEVAASLAASSVALEDHWDGPTLSKTYLAHARRLYHLARQQHGSTYAEALSKLTSDNIMFVPNNGDEDELVWAALWLHRATGERAYLNDAKNFYQKFGLRHRETPHYFSWDDKTVGAQVLLYQMTLDQQYADDARKFCDEVAFNKAYYTPRGLLKSGPDQKHGFLKHDTWAAFVCIELGETLRNYGASRNNRYIRFGIKQVHYILGDSGRSFVVGFGKNPPTRPLHCASSCPSSPARCGFEQLNSSSANPHLLLGALVEGPDAEDRYVDARDKDNAVGIVGNVGLSASLASLLHLHIEGLLTPTAYGRNR
ncbi:hypothetical protein B566_EDAN013112 [Ephemera danica]|nr:hypothetical protein B566_EDAN013112 [Ephemera danica]